MTHSAPTLPPGLEKVPPFPPVASRLLGLLSKPDVDIAEIAELVSTDAALTARLIQYVNSAVIGSARAITDVRQAVALLGFDRTRQLTIVNAAGGYAAGAPRNAELQKCWQHSLATAILADQVAKSCGVFSKTIFTAGILHDIGRLGLMVAFPAKYSRAIRDAKSRFADLLVIEREQFGVDHAEAGRLLAESWSLPSEFSMIAGRHHEFRPGAELDLLRIVHVACELADILDFGVLPPRDESDLQAVLNSLPRGTGQHRDFTVAELRVQVEDHIRKFCGACTSGA